MKAVRDIYIAETKLIDNNKAAIIDGSENMENVFEKIKSEVEIFRKI